MVCVVNKLNNLYRQFNREVVPSTCIQVYIIYIISTHILTRTHKTIFSTRLVIILRNEKTCTFHSDIDQAACPTTVLLHIWLLSWQDSYLFAEFSAQTLWPVTQQQLQFTQLREERTLLSVKGYWSHSFGSFKELYV